MRYIYPRITSQKGVKLQERGKNVLKLFEMFSNFEIYIGEYNFFPIFWTKRH